MSPPLRTLALALALLAPGCASSWSPVEVRWLRPTELKPSGQAPGARHRLVATHPDGTREFALVLAPGDEVATALAAFARQEGVVAARYAAIGAVADPAIAWFDLERRQYKVMHFGAQMEVLSLTGDVGLDASGQPVAHTHVVLGRDDGLAIGGHLVQATVSPTLEIFVTAYPKPLPKRPDGGGSGLQFFDLSAP